ncbi:MAG: hypothetical protein LBQ22_09235 [Bacteroidales bacterium]|nr:hypothetical protein [Bacteroidales bacterium]
MQGLAEIGPILIKHNGYVKLSKCSDKIFENGISKNNYEQTGTGNSFTQD